MNYNLKITQLDTVSEGGQEEVVVLAHWAYTGTDGTNTASFGGTTTLTYEAGNPFIAYADLSEEEIVEWVLGAWTPEEKESREAMIVAHASTSATPLPSSWQPPVDSTDAGWFNRTVLGTADNTPPIN